MAESDLLQGLKGLSDLELRDFARRRIAFEVNDQLKRSLKIAKWLFGVSSVLALISTVAAFGGTLWHVWDLKKVWIEEAWTKTEDLINSKVGEAIDNKIRQQAVLQRFVDTSLDIATKSSKTAVDAQASAEMTSKKAKELSELFESKMREIDAKMGELDKRIADIDRDATRLRDLVGFFDNNRLHELVKVRQMLLDKDLHAAINKYKDLNSLRNLDDSVAAFNNIFDRVSGRLKVQALETRRIEVVDQPDQFAIVLKPEGFILGQGRIHRDSMGERKRMEFDDPLIVLESELMPTNVTGQLVPMGKILCIRKGFGFARTLPEGIDFKGSATLSDTSQ